MKFEHITDNEEFLLNKNFKKIMITKTHYYLIKNVTYFFLAWEVKEINIYKKSFGMNLLLWKSLFLTTFNTIYKNIVAAGILQIFNFKYSMSSW